MKVFRWDVEKNEWLKKNRRVSFEQALLKIESGDILDIVDHQNKKKYPNQRIFIVNMGDYAYLVPFVESESEVFLKTIIPSRQATKRHLGGG